MLDHFKPQAVLLCGLYGVRAGVALIDIRQLDRIAGDLLYLFGQRCDLLAAEQVRGVTVNASRCPNVSTAM